MNKQTAVRIKGSPWQVILRRSRHDARQPMKAIGIPTQSPAANRGEDDMLLDLAIRHFVDAGLTSNETREIAAALEQVIATGRTVTVFPASSTEHPYEISRRLAAVAIRVDGQQIRLPVHAARKLADALNSLHMPNCLRDVAA